MSPQQEAGSSGDDISIRHLHDVKGVSIYKVLAGGESETLASYNEAVTKSAAERDELDGKGSLQHQDWRGMYTQMLPEHVLGTVPYRWEKAGELLHEEAILIEATFEKLEVVILEHPLFIDASVDGKTKAVIAKKALGIDEDALLMEGLGKMGKCAVIWENPEEPELIIPHALLEGPLKFTEQPVMRFKRHRDMPMTQKYCWCSNSDDKELTKEEGPVVRNWKHFTDSVTDRELAAALQPLPTEWMRWNTCCVFAARYDDYDEQRSDIYLHNNAHVIYNWYCDFASR